MKLGSYDRAKYSLRKIPLDRGGYDESGQYYGVGLPLYRATNLDDDVAREFRAHSRSDAVRTMKRLISQGLLSYEGRHRIDY